MECFQEVGKGRIGNKWVNLIVQRNGTTKIWKAQ